MAVSEIKVPELGESITEGTIATWLKKVGDQVNKGDAIVEIETDKVNVEVTSDYGGVLQEIVKDEGDNVEVDDVIAKLSESAQETEDAVTEKQEPSAEESGEAQKEDPGQSSKNESYQDEQENEQSDSIASPAARKLARKLGVDLNNVPSKDPLGRVKQDDIKAYAEKQTSQKSQNDNKITASKESKAKEKSEFSKPVERVKMSRRRQTIANRLVEVQHTAAMLTTFNEVDMTAIMDVRKRRKDKFQQKHDVRLGFMSFFAKAVVAALKEFPRLNAEIQGDEIVLKKFYDIGVAVAADEGLVVPVVRDVDRLSFAQIENQITEVAEKAKNNSLSLGDLQGGTFTITNGGVFGSLLSTPILNAPQVGILGMHKIQKRPVTVDDDEIENRPMMYIALSYDHRIVDGKEAVSFLSHLKELLEDPESLLLEG
jgi:2-oxoglutarate dehydrogenase E2 component (dihydrolipoamide succinyltransferase)